MPRERLAELLGGPRGVRTCRHRGVNHAPAVVRENDQHEQQPARRRRHDQEVRRHQLRHMVVEEGTPRLRRWLSLSDHVLRDRRLTDVDSELQELAVVRGAPHSGLASDIERIRVRTSDDSAGLPTCRLFWAQARRKSCRCQPTTVSGLTMTMALRHRGQTRDNNTQSNRSDRRSGTRAGRDRSWTWSWCRKAIISSCRAARERSDTRKVRTSERSTDMAE
jgi:hypothetical protein